MRILELEKKINDFITTTYKATYNGLLEVHKENTQYMFILGVPSYMSPTTISIDTEDEEIFLEYIYSELKVRNYMKVYFYKVIKKDAKTET